MEYDPPIRLTFKDTHDATEFVNDMVAAHEKIIWQQNAMEDGTVSVQILSITNLEDKEQE